MSRRLMKARAVVAIGLGSCLALAACSNASSGTTTATSGHTPTVSPGPGNTDGVTSNEIQIGGLASTTVPLAIQFGPIWEGVQAYLDQVNARGGVNGRKIVYTAKLNDNVGQNVQQARALVQQYHVFAIVGVAAVDFSGAGYLAQNDVPTFGYEINTEWDSGPSLFGDGGSYLNTTNPGPYAAWLAKEINAKKVATVAYAVSQSQQCATGNVNTFKKYGLDVVLNDSSLPFGTTDVSGDIQRLQSAGAQFLSTCLDFGGSITYSKAMHDAGIYDTVKQQWVDGYDPAVLAANTAQMQGIYFTTNGKVPFIKGYTAGMDQYLDAMTAHHYPINPVTLAGWLNANLFVQGLQSLGRNVTRSGLVNAINKMTAWSGNGINYPPVNWTTMHGPTFGPTCTAFVQVQGDQFARVFGNASDPFICWSNINSPTTTPISYSYPGFFNQR